MTKPTPLTDAEIEVIFADETGFHIDGPHTSSIALQDFARAIEAEVNARWLKMMKEQEPAGWRVPHDGYGKSAFTNGLPSQETIDYWRNQGVELEYAYTHPAPPVSAEPVAWLATILDDVALAHKPSDIDRHPERWIPCYTHPAPQGCELNSRPLAWIGGNCGTSFTQSLERAEKWKRKGLECVPLYRHPAPDQTALLRQALEALEIVTKHFGFARLGESRLADTKARGAAHKAMTAIKEALK